MPECSGFLLCLLVGVAALPLVLCGPRPSRPLLRSLRQDQPGGGDDICGGSLDLKTFLFMNNICEDCFRLYRDPDVYSLCREGCFSTQYFVGCMEALIVDEHTKGKAAYYLRNSEGMGGLDL